MNQSDLKNKKILVTGGAGYVGSRVSLLLDKKGYSVRVADRVLPQDKGMRFPESIECRKGDLKDINFVKDVLSGIDTVVHLAANVGSLTYMQERQAAILQENALIDANLYPSMVEAGVKRIIYSSSSMGFQHALTFPYVEEDLPAIPPPTNVYGFSKLIGEYFCKAYQKQYGLSYVIVRYHNIYGPGEEYKGEGYGNIHVVPALINKIISGQRPVELLGNANATRTFTYIDDAVEATVMIIEKAISDTLSVVNNDFNIGSKEAISMVNLAKMIWEMLIPDKPFEYVVKETDAITSDRREMDPKKIEKIIGWKPNISLREGLDLLIETIKHMKK